MVRYRYSVRTLIVVVTLVAVYFPLARFYDSWYTSKYGEYYTSNVLGFKIHNGDSLNQVASHFGSYQAVGHDHHFPAISMTIAELCARNNWPVEEGDQFYRFSTPGGDGGTYLQFRNNKLINLKNSDYADAGLLAKMNGFSLPHPALTLGFLPLYLTTVLSLAILYLWFRRKRSSHMPNTAQANACNLGADVS